MIKIVQVMKFIIVLVKEQQHLQKHMFKCIQTCQMEEKTQDIFSLQVELQ